MLSLLFVGVESLSPHGLLRARLDDDGAGHIFAARVAVKATIIREDTRLVKRMLIKPQGEPPYSDSPFSRRINPNPCLVPYIESYGDWGLWMNKYLRNSNAA
jgi:hypothetical protein